MIERLPQVLVNLRSKQKRPLDAAARRCQALIADVERQLGDDGRVLVRYSGTEAKARVLIEGPDAGASRATPTRSRAPSPTLAAPPASPPIAVI